MPIYEYACQDCGHEMEVIQKINDLPLEDCPVCGQSALKKKISVSGFRLKGTGWYETDFKQKKTETTTNNNKTEKKAASPESSPSS